MSVTYETRVGYEPQTEAALFNEALDRVWKSGDPNEQYAAFLIYDNPLEGTFGPSLPKVSSFAAEHFDRLVAFAASAEASPSLLVRAQALDYAVHQLTGAIGADPDAARANGLLERQAELHELIPEAVLDQHGHLKTFDGLYRKPVTFAVDRLIVQEGLNDDVVFQNWEGYDQDFKYEIPYNVPITAFMLAEQLSSRQQAGRPLPDTPLAASLAPLALALGNTIGAELGVSESSLSRYQKIQRLAPLIEHGTDYMYLREYLLGEKSDFVDVLSDLYSAAELLTEVFPTRYATGVERGVRELVASSMYVLYASDNLSYGQDVKLPLGNRPEALTLHLEKRESIALLADLKNAILQIHEDATTCPVVPVVKDGQFSYFRFLRPEGSRTTAYIRPHGAVRYDPELEYGRPGEGVEASIGFTTDLRPHLARLSRIGRHRLSSPDTRISIRLDREGIRPEDRGKPGMRRDPTQAEGTLSLDVGSVLGDDEWLGTKIGRFLAWGNLLRTRRIGGKISLNHVTDFFEPTDGLADVFAIEAEGLRAGLERRGRRFRPQEIAAYYAGRAAAN